LYLYFSHPLAVLFVDLPAGPGVQSCLRLDNIRILTFDLFYFDLICIFISAIHLLFCLLTHLRDLAHSRACGRPPPPEQHQMSTISGTAVQP
jgi:hypothetical protein